MTLMMAATAGQHWRGCSATALPKAIAAAGASCAAIYWVCAGWGGSGAGCTPRAASSAAGEGSPPPPGPEGCTGWCWRQMLCPAWPVRSC